MNPRQIFINHILKPMALNPADETRATPTSVFDSNRGKPEASNHILICTFTSPDSALIIKQNTGRLPNHVKLCPKVPPQYTDTLNEYLRTQSSIKRLRDTNGNPLAKSRITSHNGHLTLEKADRIGNTYTSFHPIKTFIPQTPNSPPPTITPTQTKKLTLITCTWKHPINKAAQADVTNHLSNLKTPHHSAYASKYRLSITTKLSDSHTVKTHLGLHPLTQLATISSSDF